MVLKIFRYEKAYIFRIIYIVNTARLDQNNFLLLLQQNICLIIIIFLAKVKYSRNEFINKFIKYRDIFSENNAPVFLQNVTSITVTLGETFTLTLDATDADDEELTFDVPNIPPGASFNSSDNTLYFSWPVNSTDEVATGNIVLMTGNTFSWKNGTRV